MAVFFNGRLLRTPTSASFLDDTGMFNKNITVGNVAVLIGRADGGKPLTALRFGSAEQGRKTLIGDDTTLKAIEKAFDPSSETAAPQEVIFIRINPATQAALTLKDASNGDAIRLVSTDYGRRNNQIKVKVESGSIRGKKLTTQFGNAYFSADNVFCDAFDLRYAGVEAAGAVTVSGTQIVLKAGSEIAATIELTDFPTVQELIDRINAVEGFTANVIDGNGDKPALQGLDFVTDLDVKTAVVKMTANLQACIDWFNGTSEGYVTASRAPGAGAAPANIGFTYMAGATDGNVTNAEWQAAFDVLQGIDAQWIAPLTASAAVHAMTDAHVAFMSSTTRKKRRAFVGDGNAVPIDAALTAAKALNSDRTSYLYQGIYDYDPKGKLKLYPAYVAAAMLAGMAAGVNPGAALTNKTVKVRGIEVSPRNPTDTDVLLAGGVLPLEETEQGLKVVQSITTCLWSDNYTRVEQSVGAAADFVLRNVEEAVDTVRGKKGTPLSMSEIKSKAETRLRELARPEPMGPGVLVGDEKNPPFRHLQVSLDGDVVRLEYECSPVIPINYILQVAHALPYSGVASA